MTTSDDTLRSVERAEQAEPGAASHAGEEAQHEHHHGYIADKDAYLRRMKRIEGQARGIAKMIDEEKYCIDILTQVSALTRALQGVATGLLEDHLSHCVVDAARMGDEEARVKIKEATDAINRLVRS
ncbi:metal-sensitive transcriptional regulator [Calidifontibacter indicus]|uniref:metal-sensitive transcriptional regulator n=1 Tax=Calidifontibacter indicus TaxID=419650 RepID=UPI003D712A7D